MNCLSFLSFSLFSAALRAAFSARSTRRQGKAFCHCPFCWRRRGNACPHGGHAALGRWSWPFSAALSPRCRKNTSGPVWRWPAPACGTAPWHPCAVPPDRTAFPMPRWNACARPAAARWNWGCRALMTRPCARRGAATAGQPPCGPAPTCGRTACTAACSSCPACRG